MSILSATLHLSSASRPSGTQMQGQGQGAPRVQWCAPTSLHKSKEGPSMEFANISKRGACKVNRGLPAA
jgi:hypothetical protein